MQFSTKPRILAIAPGAQYVGLAVLEGEDLIWFGVKSFPGQKTVESLLESAKQIVEDFISRYQPSIVVVEDPFYTQARLSPLVRALHGAIKRWSRQRGLRVMSYRPTAVKERLCPGKKTRKTLGEAVVRRFPFLYGRPLKTWHYWQQMLEAIALGILALTDVKNGRENAGTK